MHGKIDPSSHDIWLPADEPFMRAAHGLIMCRLPSWELSYGMGMELMTFAAAGKPVAWMFPDVVPELE